MVDNFLASRMHVLHLSSMQLPRGIEITGKTWVISDTHFGHDRMLKYSKSRLAIARAPIKNIHDLDAVEWGTERNDQHAEVLCMDDFARYWKVDELIESRWRMAVASANELVVHLGDFARDDISNKEVRERSKRLRGKKLLIKGNHDPGDLEAFTSSGWITVVEPAITIPGISIDVDIHRCKYPPRDTACIVASIGATRVMFSHVPAFYNPGLHEELPQDQARFTETCRVLQEIFVKCGCTINIHGHVHGREPSPGSVNASVECTNFMPVRVKDLVSKC